MIICAQPFRNSEKFCYIQYMTGKLYYIRQTRCYISSTYKYLKLCNIPYSSPSSSLLLPFPCTEHKGLCKASLAQPSARLMLCKARWSSRGESSAVIVGLKLPMPNDNACRLKWSIYSRHNRVFKSDVSLYVVIRF